MAGATVRHQLRFFDAGIGLDERRERRLFLRELRTNADGLVEVVPGSGDNVLTAHEGPERSLPWRGRLEGEVRLELLPTIEISGRVRASDPDLDLARASFMIGFFSAADRSDFVLAGSGPRLRPDGTFGPSPWPRPEHAFVLVRVFGGELIATHAEAALPVDGRAVVFDLEARRGLPFDVAVQLPDESPVDGASVWGFQLDGAAWVDLGREITGPDGRAVLFGGTGTLALEVAKPGHATISIENERLVLPQTAAPFLVVLRAAGVVEGRVLSGGDPVRKFRIVAWDDQRTYSVTLPFESEQGVFRLEDVPREVTIRLLAYVEGRPQSNTKSFALDAGEPPELLLELPTPRRARGRVIDSLTGQAVPTARIQHLISGMNGFVGAHGEGMAVQADGRFELDGFFPGRGGFSCAAEGYETLHYHTREDDLEVIDVGLLPLNPLATLAVVVRARPVSDYAGFIAWNQASDDRTPRPVGSDGTLTLPTLSGSYEVRVLRPDGVLAVASGRVLPGSVERVVVDFSAGIELVVSLSDAPRDVSGWSLAAASRSAHADRRTQAAWSAERAAFVLEGVAPGPVVLELRDAEGTLVAQRSVRLDEAPQQSLQLSLDGVSRRLRLEDGAGRPWAVRPVTVSLEEPSGWAVQLETDEQGEFVIGPLDAQRVVLSSRLSGEALAYGVRVELEPDPARTTVVALEAGPRSLLRLHEEGRPVAGLHVLYTHELGPKSLYFAYSSDEEGLVRGPFLAPGTYTLIFHHRETWPARTLLTQEDSGAVQPLEVFSRARLRVRVSEPGGAPRAGVHLELRHEQLGEDVAQWLAAGRLEAPGDLVTDAEGYLTLDGVPRGDYEWAASAADGARRSGALHLAPREDLEFSILLPRP